MNKGLKKYVGKGIIILRRYTLNKNFLCDGGGMVREKFLKCFFLMLLIIFISNIVFAREKWDDFRLRFIEEYQKENGGKLTDDDIQRMIDGPTDEDKSDGSINWDSAAIEEFQEAARNLKETRAQGGTGLNNEKWEKAKEEAKELYNKMQSAIKKANKENIKKYAKAVQEKFAEARKYNSKKTTQDNDFLAWNADASKALKDLGETPKNNFTNQVNNKGNTETPGEEQKNNKIYKQPNIITGSTNVDGTLDDMISDAGSFVSKGDQTAVATIETDGLKDLSGRIYNILLEIGIGAAVLIGIILGIKFLLSGVEEKAQVKKMIWVYSIGCIVTFGAFGIWKIVVTILQQL